MVPEPSFIGRCAACDYDLRGAPRSGSDRCPECGLLLTAGAVRSARERSFFRCLAVWSGVAITAVVAVAFAGGLVLGDMAIQLVPLLVFLVAPAAPVIVAAYCVRRLAD